MKRKLKAALGCAPTTEKCNTCQDFQKCLNKLAVYLDKEPDEKEREKYIKAFANIKFGKR